MPLFERSFELFIQRSLQYESKAAVRPLNTSLDSSLMPSGILTCGGSRFVAA